MKYATRFILEIVLLLLILLLTAMKSVDAHSYINNHGSRSSAELVASLLVDENLETEIKRAIEVPKAEYIPCSIVKNKGRQAIKIIQSHGAHGGVVYSANVMMAWEKDDGTMGSHSLENDEFIDLRIIGLLAPEEAKEIVKDGMKMKKADFMAYVRNFKDTLDQENVAKVTKFFDEDPFETDLQENDEFKSFIAMVREKPRQIDLASLKSLRLASIQ